MHNYSKILLTAILCFFLNTTNAQISVGVGCTVNPCSSCIAGYTGGTWSSSNTLRGTVSTTGVITGISVGTTIISYVFTATGCGTGVFVTTVSVVPAVASATISQIAPFVLAGDEAYTYCASTGFTLKVNTVPITLPGATYSWDDGVGAPTVVSTNTFAPTYTSGSTAVTHAYTVTVSRGGCTTTATVNVVVPPTGCSPCDAFIVNTHQTTPISSGTCPDCSTLQTFHTIISSSLSATNVADNENYYVVNDATFTKSAHYLSNVFYMNGSSSTGGVTLTVPTSPAITLSDCHLFSSSSCPWNGIDVTVTSSAAGSLTLGSTLIEHVIDAIGLHRAAVNITGVGSGSYYSSSMPDILSCQSSIFNNNYGGIHFNSYAPSVATASTMPFSVVASTFTNRDLANGGPVGSTSAANYPFNWESSGTLNTITTASTQDPVFGTDVYSPFSYTTTLGHHGIQLNSVGSYSLVTAGSSTVPDINSYNYGIVGSSTPDASMANTNLFDNMRFGVQVDHSNAKFFNNTFRRVTEGVGFYNEKNDLQIIGSSSPSDNTNNRFFANTQSAVHSELYTPFDFTCNDAEFRSPNITNEAINMVLWALYSPAEHGTYTINNNYIYNYTRGVVITYATGGAAASTTVAAGITSIKSNNIIGKTASGSWSENVLHGIYFTDDRAFSSTPARGLVEIELNNIQNVANGITFKTTNQSGEVNDNIINMADYGSLDQVGISTIQSQFMAEIKENTIGAFGWNCSPTTATFTKGILSENIGSSGYSTDISCNAVHDVNIGFEFKSTNVLQWTDNQMMRNQKGLYLSSSAVLGTQGSVCDPADNHWDNGTCTFCSASCSVWPTAGWADAAVSETYIETGVSAASSPIWVRTVTPYYPTNNGGPGTAYSTGTLLDAIGSCTLTLSATPTCASSSGFRPAPPSKYTSRVDKASVYTVNPNPSDGNLIITRDVPTDAPVNVSVVNVLGQQVYSNNLRFDNGKTNIILKNAVPGMYQVKITDKNGEVWNNKIIIDKR